jgi:hypothetical protein
MNAFSAELRSKRTWGGQRSKALTRALTGIGLALFLVSALPQLSVAGFLEPLVPAQGSTSPANGDLNPYGVAVVPGGFPDETVQPGQLLVSNFNNSLAGGNIQGQGSTVVIIDPNTAQQLGVFYQGSMPIGFTNALGMVRVGFVFAGSVFTTGSGSNVSPGQNGGLLVLDSNGKLVHTVMTGVNGPWGLAIRDEGDEAQLFVSNVLDGTVTRLEVSFEHGVKLEGAPVTIGSGYSFGPDAAGLVVGPAGLAYDSRHDILYVASEDDNEIFAIQHASTAHSSSGQGMLVYSDDAHLHGPLGLIIAPNGDLVTANADPAAHVDPAQPSEIVEFTTGGKFVREFSIDPNSGSAFAILNVGSFRANQFAYVDDFSSIINILRLAPR